MGFFLTAHDRGLVPFDIPQPGFLVNRSSLTENFGLPFDFILDGVFDELERVDILEFHLGAQFIGAHGPQRKVGFTAKTALFHVAVTDVDIHQHVTQGLQIRDDFVRRAHIRLGHNFNQRRSRPIQIDKTAGIRVNVFPRVFFQMRSTDSDLLGRPVALQLQPAILANGPVILGYLIALRQVRVKIVFSGKLIRWLHGAMQRQSRPNGHFHRTLIHDRQRTRQSQTHGTGPGVGG